MAREELRVAQDVLQEQDVGLHPSDVELIQRSLHLLYCMQVRVASANDLQQQQQISPTARQDCKEGKIPFFTVASILYFTMSLPISGSGTVQAHLH